MSTGVIFILGKGVTPILASGVKSTWPQGSSAPGFSIVRIKALLRRYGENRTEDIRFAIGAYTFNVTTQTLSFGDKETELSHFEAKILEHLATNIGKTVDASELMIAVWQRDEQSNRNSLHGYIHKLRRALRHDPSISIINQRGFGYMLVIRS